MRNFLGFSLIEVLIALALLSGFVLLSFEVLGHFQKLEQSVHEEYVELQLLV